MAKKQNVIYVRDAKKRKKPYPYATYARDFRNYIGWQYPRGSANSIEFWGHDPKTASPMQNLNRKVARFYGPGKYDWKTLAKYGLRGAGALAGGLSALEAGPAAMVPAAQAGWKSGARLSKFLGAGDYQQDVAVNSLIQNEDHPSHPVSMNPQQNISVNSISNEGDVIISFTEFVQNVSVIASGSGTTNFAIQSFPINPGLSSAFPWLSQIANNFTLYEFDGLMFQYKPTSGEYGSTNSNSLGKVIMATNYDPDAAAFISSQAMENYDYAVATKPSCGMVHGVETHPAQRLSNQLYVRSGNTSKDKVLTDLGLFQVATEGIFVGSAGTFVIGELWVTYKIKLSRKLLGNAALGLAILYDSWSATPANVGPTTAMLVANAGNSLGGVLTASGASATYTFPVNISAGYFYVWCAVESITSAGTNTPLFGTTTQTNCTPKSIGPSGIGASYPNTLNNNVANPGPKVACLSVMLQITAPGSLQASIVMPFANDGTSKFTFCVTQISQALYINDP